eukprot:353231-Chlamydomonas_euryale.AAC.7
MPKLLRLRGKAQHNACVCVCVCVCEVCGGEVSVSMRAYGASCAAMPKLLRLRRKAQHNQCCQITVFGMSA